MTCRHRVAASSCIATVMLCVAGSCLAPAARLHAQATTASLAGIVVTAGLPNQPLRRAIVTLSDPAGVRVSAVTDDTGRFVLSGVQPGRYQLSASKPGYLTAYYGAREPGEPDTALSLAAASHLDDIMVRLVRGAVVTGTLRDRHGTALPNVVVAARPVGNVRTFITADGSAGQRAAVDVPTDDRGVYRIHGLPPGEYVILASPALNMRPRPTAQRSTSEMNAAIRLLEQRGARGVSAEMPASGAPVTTAPIFYPGTPMARDAARIQLNAGEERAGLDFWLDLVPTSRVEATVARPPGRERESLAVLLTPVGPSPTFVIGTRGQLGPDGRVTFPNVAPGEYVLNAIAGSGAERVWARQPLVIDGADVTGLSLTLQPALTFAGSIVMDQPTASLADLASLRVALRGDADPRAFHSEDSTAIAAGEAAASGVRRPFSVHGILPGRYALSASIPRTLGRTWWLKSAVAGGRDLLDAPLDFAGPGQDIRDAVLTLTDRRTELTGRLQTAAGQPATEYVVIVFSADRAHWFPGALRTRAVRPASDGVFSVTELPAGRYLVAAVTAAVTDEWQRPSFLEQLAQFAVPVAVSDGATVRQDLQIAR